MKTMIGSGLILTLVLSLAVPAQAQKKKNKGNAEPAAIGQLNKSLEKVELTDEQKASIKEILAKHKGPLAELQKAKTALIGPEATKQMNEARKAATAEGKKGKELQAAVQEAAGLSEDVAKELDELQKKLTAAAGKLKTDVLAVLTDEQKEASGITVRTGGKGNRKKKAAAN